jgi:hypothetical protein
MTYRSGWSVIEQTVVQRERWSGAYDVKSTPLVYPGQMVLPDQPILRLQLVKSIEQASRQPATEIVPSGLLGRVVKITLRGGVVIESHATVMKGTIGFGKQVAGVLTLWPPEKNGRLPSSLPQGAILVVPGSISFAFLHQVLASGISGVIASSIVAPDLEGFLRTDFIQLLDYDAIEMAQLHLPPVTLFLTEGLGTFAMPTDVLKLLSHFQGKVVLLSGITSVHRGIFPELVISLSQRDEQSHTV